MASSSLPPWLDVKPSDFTRSASEGAQAGEGAARIQQASIAEHSRTALELNFQQNQLAEAGAKLSQQERLAAMENQAREEISQKAAARQSQEHEIQKARTEAMMGLGKARLQQAADIQQQKAKAAASAFADEQGFAQDLANKVPVAVAYYRHPRIRPAVLASLERSLPKEVNKGEPLQSQPVFDADGKPIQGIIAVPGPGGRMSVRNLPKQPEPELPQGPGLLSKIGNLFSPSGMSAISNASRSGGSAPPAASPVPPPAAVPPPEAPSKTSHLKEGTRVRNKKTGKMGTVINGVVVPDDENADTGE